MLTFIRCEWFTLSVLSREEGDAEKLERFNILKNANLENDQWKENKDAALIDALEV